MSDKLTKEEIKELEKLMEEILKEAKSVVEDYTKNPSLISGRTQIRIQEDSPWLDETKPFIPLTKKNVVKKKKD